MESVSTSGRPTAPIVSVVVPCYNEEESIRVTHERLTEVLTQAVSC